MFDSQGLRAQRAARRTAALGLAACVALGLAGCRKPPAGEEPVRAVKLMTAAAGPVAAEAEYAGDVRARVESRLGFRVGGKIVSRAAEPGQRVAAGQVLAQLDARDYQLAADAARAQVQSATTQRDLAAADVKRYQALRDQGFISGAEMERRSAQLKAAQATLDQAAAQQTTQGNQAAYTQLRADAPGVVTAVDAEVGQVVAAGTPVVRVAQDGPRDAVFAVPEDVVGAVRVGQPVAVRAWSGGAPLAGTVREVAASADPATRTFQVKVAIAGQAPPLGATVSVRVAAPTAAAGAPAVIKLPTTALVQSGAGSAVWVFDAASSTVRPQPVQVTGTDGNDVVIAGGLAPGTRVVMAGAHVLTPGQKVTVYESKAAAAQAQSARAAMNSEASASPAPPGAPAAGPAGPTGVAAPRLADGAGRAAPLR